VPLSVQAVDAGLTLPHENLLPLKTKYSLMQSRRYLNLLGLAVLFIGGGWLFYSLYSQAVNQVRVSVGEPFPAIGLATKQKQLIAVVKNGCTYCEKLKVNLDSVMLNMPKSHSERITFLTIDEAPETPLTFGKTVLYDTKLQEQNFGATPQLFFLNDSGIVVKKHLGLVSTEKLKHDMALYLSP
jgi:hypothetical protein